MAIPNIFTIVLLLPLHLAFGNVTMSSTLYAGDRNSSWLSSSNEFAFGFCPINNSTNLFLLAIWFDKIPTKTIIWNADIPDPVPPRSRVQLTPTGLSLTNPQGRVMWAIELEENVSYGAMLDTGNFVLVSSSSQSWQSFNNPTDTLLPTQTLDLSSKLSSRLSPFNYTKGRFELYFDNGNLSLSQIGWPAEYHYTKYFDISMSSSDSASQLVFNSSGQVYVKTKSGDQIAFGLSDSSLSVRRYYYRVTLDSYGVLSLYSHPRASNEDQVWSIEGHVPENICNAIFSDMGSGCCGYNSYCSWDDNSKRPTCSCPEGYSLVDLNDIFGGCLPDFSLGCGADDAPSRENPEEVYDMKPLQSVNWPLGDYEKLINYTKDECKKSCLYDCNCVVVISNTGKECWKKRLPLSNGRLSASEGGTTSLLKLRIQPVGNLKPSLQKENRVQPALLGSLIGSLVIITLLVASFVSFIFFKPKKTTSQVSSLVETNMHSFTYEALKEATHDFSEEVGRGSFGIVYKGALKSMTNTVVAVKRLDRMAQEREKEFRNELSAIGNTCHKNLVRLIGFCDEGVHRLLVYEFMSNGTLADILFGKFKPVWNLRVNFALGIARGLLYLHEECDTPILHCDIKPQNILIDEHLRAKISDFGLAKLLCSNQSRTNTVIRGTRGYVAPEWFKNVPVTAKVDVYSYGVVLLEIICSKRSVEKDIGKGEEEEVILTDWAYDCYVEGRIDILVENDDGAMADVRLRNWVMIAMLCIQENPEARPSMRTVMQMLEGLVDIPNPPPPSFYTTV
ncbi:G-type lectin S-receptor-like serine/threonine-protein kinase LECRK1 [Prosopis cineraria]|uniref:G-type lectin S-receptor-like serine/threonine-protein kinase LECRK1 n=1 Tax=Prosopis cineraria TaxID=364024 RepID=UPI0024104218|nr:G-type lectin S-receptor-like serine/threonine-protein kinase LECRK1 [Prosopis cineraria]